MKTIMTKRLVLDAGERQIRATWGADWKYMRADEDRHGKFAILTGGWSGYAGGGRRPNIHVQYLPFEQTKTIRLHTIRFTDGTTLDIFVEWMTIEGLLLQGLKKRLTYDDLIKTARGTLQEEYQV